MEAKASVSVSVSVDGDADVDEHGSVDEGEEMKTHAHRRALSAQQNTQRALPQDGLQYHAYIDSQTITRLIPLGKAGLCFNRFSGGT